jgi:polysaccharide export outer membrane protein
MNNRLNFVLFLVSTLFFTSCVSHKELVNFNNEEAPLEVGTEDIVNAMNLTIQPEDLLRIQVHSADKDQLAALPFNIELPNQQQNMVQQANQAGSGGNYPIELFNGYLVDQEGNIDFPVIGKIEVNGLTLEEAKAKLVSLLEKYINIPIVNMRFLNLKITILGEVNNPGTIRLSNKRVTLLEAIGMAGDMSIYANRNNVLVIREENGKRTTARLDLQTAEIFTSPYFYLQQNDVVYIEPTKARIATVADPVQRFISYGSGVLSIVTLIIALTR